MAATIPQCEVCGRAPATTMLVTKGRGPSKERHLNLCRACALLNTADTLASISGFGAWLAARWLRLFDLSPRATSVITIVFGISVAISTTIDTFGLAPPPDRQRQEPAYVDQIAALDQTKASLDRLSRFIEVQRERVEADERALLQIRAARQELEPLLSADRRVVNALLREQEARLGAAATQERWIGFALGVISSIVASALLALAGLFLRRRAMRRLGDNEDAG